MQKVLLVVLIVLIGTGAYFLGKNQLISNRQTQVSSSTPQITPEKFTQDFYDQYLACVTPAHDIKGCLGTLANQGKIDSVLANNLAIAGHYDHVLCDQSPPQKITVSNAISTENKTMITVHTFYQYSGEIPLKVELTSTNGSWKITGITCPPPLQ